jgi:hypothetical protein
MQPLFALAAEDRKVLKGVPPIPAAERVALDVARGQASNLMVLQQMPLQNLVQASNHLAAFGRPNIWQDVRDCLNAILAEGLCDFCAEGGHDHSSCPWLKKMGPLMAAKSASGEWGQIKYALWHRECLADPEYRMRQMESRRAPRFGRKRFFRRRR